jgi:excisionase family DNA binding protein
VSRRAIWSPGAAQGPAGGLDRPRDARGPLTARPSPAPAGAVLGRIAELHEQLAQAHRDLAGILQQQLAGAPDPRLMSHVPADPTPNRLLGTLEVADVLGLSQRSVRRLRRQGKLPPGIEVGGTIRWRSEEIEEWLAR